LEFNIFATDKWTSDEIIFAFEYQYDPKISESDQEDKKINGWRVYQDPNKEFERQGIDFKDKLCPFREFWCNSDFSVCNSYPKKLIVPHGLSDHEIKKCANFRTKGRLPG
jgi:hypothetical protein